MEQEAHLVLPAWGWGRLPREPCHPILTLGSSMPIPCTASCPVNPAQPRPQAPRAQDRGVAAPWVPSVSAAICHRSPRSQPLCGNRDEVTRCPLLTCPWLAGTRGPRLLSPESSDQRRVPGAPTLQLLLPLEPKLRVRLKDTVQGGRHSHPKSRP